MQSIKDTWPLKAAVVVTHSNQNVGMMLKELLRSFQWTVVQTTPLLEVAFDQIHSGKATMLIVDDCVELPSIFAMRQLLADPIAALTPTIAFVGTMNRVERAAIVNLGRPMIVDKPLTPSRFLPGMKTLIKVWSSGYFPIARHAINTLVSGDEEQAVGILMKLAENPQARVIIAPALAYMLRRRGNVQTAEKVLLAALKSMPRNLGLLLSLADHYMHAAMPQMALRLITSAEAIYGITIATLADRCQAHLMMQNLDGAINALKGFQELHFFPAEYQSYLARIFYAEGRLADFEKTLGNPQKAQKFIEAWHSTNEKNAGPDGFNLVDDQPKAS